MKKIILLVLLLSLCTIPAVAGEIDTVWIRNHTKAGTFGGFEINNDYTKVVGVINEVLYFFDTENGDLLDSIVTGSSVSFRDFDISSDFKYAVMINGHGGFFLIDTENKEEVLSFGDAIECAISDDGSFFFVTMVGEGQNGQQGKSWILRYELPSLKKTDSLFIENKFASSKSMEISTDGNYFAFERWVETEYVNLSDTTHLIYAGTKPLMMLDTIASRAGRASIAYKTLYLKRSPYLTYNTGSYDDDLYKYNTISRELSVLATKERTQMLHHFFSFYENYLCGLYWIGYDELIAVDLSNDMTFFDANFYAEGIAALPDDKHLIAFHTAALMKIKTPWSQVGVEELPNDNILTTYENGRLTIELNTEEYGRLNVVLFSIEGSKISDIYNGNIVTGSNFIQKEINLSSGSYFLTFHINGSYLSKKFLVIN